MYALIMCYIHYCLAHSLVPHIRSSQPLPLHSSLSSLRHCHAHSHSAACNIQPFYSSVTSPTMRMRNILTYIPHNRVTIPLSWDSRPESGASVQRAALCPSSHFTVFTTDCPTKTDQLRFVSEATKFSNSSLSNNRL